MPDHTQFRVFGHRGAAALEPENTLRSFIRAVKEGVHGIEFDVQEVDGHLILLHDDTVDRTSNASGLLTSFTFEELRQLDFGQGEVIPTLREAIDSIPDHILINIELKGPDTGKPVSEVVSEYAPRPFMISSFRLDELVQFRSAGRVDPSVDLALLRIGFTDQAIREAKSVEATAINLCDPFVDQEVVEKVRSAGFELFVYTVNEPPRAEELMKMGASGVFTDRPDIVRVP